jgi:hypothetical protein
MSDGTESYDRTRRAFTQQKHKKYIQEAINALDSRDDWALELGLFGRVCGSTQCSIAAAGVRDGNGGPGYLG